jgi:hypothetical protein
MQPLQHWPLGKVARICAGWIILGVLLTAAWDYLAVQRQINESSGSGGIGSVSAGVSEPVFWLGIVPAFALFVGWLIAKLFVKSRAV